MCLGKEGRTQWLEPRMTLTSQPKGMPGQINTEYLGHPPRETHPPTTNPFTYFSILSLNLGFHLRREKLVMVIIPIVWLL